MKVSEHFYSRFKERMGTIFTYKVENELLFQIYKNHTVTEITQDYTKMETTFRDKPICLVIAKDGTLVTCYIKESL